MMKKQHIALLLLLLLLNSCGKNYVRVAKELPKAEPPQAVIVTQVIDSEIFGTKLANPYGLSTDNRGNLYCVDSGNDRLIKFNEALTPVLEVGGSGIGEGYFHTPTFVTIDNDLNLYVTDEGNRRICRFTSVLEFVDEFKFAMPDNPAEFGVPSGTAVNEYGELWVADRDENQIVIFNNVGSFDRLMGQFGSSGGELRIPEKIIRDTGDRYVVCDAGNSRIVMYDDYGTHLSSIYDPLFDYPAGATTTVEGIWTIDRNSGRLFLHDYLGQRLFVSEALLTGLETKMSEPLDIARLSDGRLVISDSGNNRLLVCRIIR